MDKIVKFNNQSSGRDKLFRLIQYSSRIIWASLEQKSKDENFIKKIKEIEYMLSTGRKLFRFGKSIDILYSALNSISLQDLTLRHTITLSRISTALYLFSDHIIWLGRAGIIDINKSKWANLNSRFWLYFVIMNLCRDVYELKRLFVNFQMGRVNHEVSNNNYKKSNTLVSRIRLLVQLLSLHQDVVIDTVKNGCDVCIPLTLLGYLNLSPKTMGILGAISSIAGMLPLIDSQYKLMP